MLGSAALGEHWQGVELTLENAVTTNFGQYPSLLKKSASGRLCRKPGSKCPKSVRLVPFGA
jgi:hypothetical protein